MLAVGEGCRWRKEVWLLHLDLSLVPYIYVSTNNYSQVSTGQHLLQVFAPASWSPYRNEKGSPSLSAISVVTRLPCLLIY